MRLGSLLVALLATVAWGRPASALAIDNGLSNVLDARSLGPDDGVTVRDAADGRATSVKVTGPTTAVYCGADVFGRSALTLAGGSADCGVSAHDDSTLLFQGGLTESGGTAASDRARVLIRSGGPTESLQLYDSTSLAMTGGRIGTALFLTDASSGWLKGGEIVDCLHLEDRSSFLWRGGTIRGTMFCDSNPGPSLLVSDLALLRIVGSDFFLDGAPVGGIVSGDIDGILSGTLRSGESFRIDLVVAGGGRLSLGPPVPEPTAALAFLAGLVVFRTAIRRRSIAPASQPCAAGPKRGASLATGP